MGCGASNAGGGGASGGTRTESRRGKGGGSGRDAVADYVAVFLTQPIFHAQVQAALRTTAKEPAEQKAALAALETIRSKLADYCDVSGGAARSAFNAKLRSSLSDDQCEAFAALRCDFCAHVVAHTFAHILLTCCSRFAHVLLVFSCAGSIR